MALVVGVVVQSDLKNLNLKKKHLPIGAVNLLKGMTASRHLAEMGMNEDSQRCCCCL